VPPTSDATAAAACVEWADALCRALTGTVSRVPLAALVEAVAAADGGGGGEATVPAADVVMRALMQVRRRARSGHMTLWRVTGCRVVGSQLRAV
jgi:hypothetical protein